jgi:hypothetical protein
MKVRTAFFCWLFARHHGGEFVLRIEDTDRRSVMTANGKSSTVGWRKARPIAAAARERHSTGSGESRWPRAAIHETIESVASDFDINLVKIGHKRLI